MRRDTYSTELFYGATFMAAIPTSEALIVVLTLYEGLFVGAGDGSKGRSERLALVVVYLHRSKSTEDL